MPKPQFPENQIAQIQAISIADQALRDTSRRTNQGGKFIVSDGTNDAEEECGSGGASIAGYEFQIDVSVWLALDLVPANKLTHELILEPATEEDLEADLAEHQPGPVTSDVLLEDYRLTLIAAVCSLAADRRVSISATIAARSRSSAVSRVMRSVILISVCVMVEFGECARSLSAA
jgi:hypothetical protein